MRTALLCSTRELWEAVKSNFDGALFVGEAENYCGAPFPPHREKKFSMNIQETNSERR